MQMNIQIRKKIFLTIVLLCIVLISRLLTREFDSVGLVIFTLAPAPILYWLVVPYIYGLKMEMPSWGFALERNKNPISRFLLFALGVILYLIFLLS